MQRAIQLIITLLTVTFLASCSSNSNKDWHSIIPEETTLLIVPENGTNVQDIITKEYISVLDDLTPSAVQQLSGLNSELSNNLQIKALALYPTTSQYSNLLWFIRAPATNIKDWAPRYYEPFSQNYYDFLNRAIHRLIINNTELYATQIQNTLLLSESSLAIENSIRAYNGAGSSIKLKSEPLPSTLVINTPELHRWIEQLSLVKYRPSLIDKFEGTSPVSLTYSTTVDSTHIAQLSGNIDLQSGTHSALVDAISYQNKPITLDQHIASNAAAFALLRLPPVSIPSEPASGIITPLDSLLLNDLELYQQMANTLNSEFAFEAFAESGLLATGEYVFLRKLRDRREFQRILNQFARNGLIIRLNNSYQVSSEILGVLIGSELSPLRDFYLSFSNDVVAIAKRRGVAESVNTDRIRRRVIYYDDTYSNVRDKLPNEVSGFVWSVSDEIVPFLKPYLKSEHVLPGLFSKADISSITMTTSTDNLNFTLDTYVKEGARLPYEELWVMPLSNLQLSGKPVLGDIIGSSTPEIIFSTNDGRIIALAIDGTIVMETSTEELAPIGSPQLYDWYGNNQQVVFSAAGSKIFAWNENGNLLPRFPIDLGRQITSPILIRDILQNGVPEIVVATEDRRVHVLDGRGENVRGWPQNTNAPVQNQPVFSTVDGTWSVWAYSENTLHSWLQNGTTRPGYPQFVNARFTNSPLIYENQVLGSAGDGHLYSIGLQPLFNDSTATVISDDSVSVRSLYVANGLLTSATVHENVLMKDTTNFYREDLIGTLSANGSVFFYNKQGELRFTQSLGQPASPTLDPQLVDINSDMNYEVIALAEFGRLYAWEILTDKRLYSLPTSGMKFPIITDLNNDGRKELIAQTREGLRCWTIYREN